MGAKLTGWARVAQISFTCFIGVSGLLLLIYTTWALLSEAQAAPLDQNIAHQTSFKRYLDANGDGTGDINIVGDYSSITTTFYIQPPITRTYTVAKVKIVVEDDTDFPTGGYGSIIAPGLTNGILLQVVDDSGVISDQLGGFPVTTNAEWGLACEISFADLSAPGQGGDNNFLQIVCFFARPITLNGARNERLEFVGRDDFTPLISQYVIVDVFIQ